MHSRFWILLASIAMLCAPAAAQESQRWAPPEPAESRWDWIKLVSGEWLKGELDRVRDDVVYFESDKLDDLEIDLEDISLMRLGRLQAYRFDGRRIVRGTAELRGDVIRVRAADGEVTEYKRDELVNIVSGRGNEIDRWSFELGASLSARSGNTDQQDYSGNAELLRETPLTRWRSTYRGSFATVDGDKTVNNHRVMSEWDYFVTRYFFVTPNFEYYTDEFQNIDVRLTPGFTVGYQFLDRSWVEWTAATGVAFQQTLFDTSTTGADSAQDFVNLFDTRLDFDLPRDVEFENSYRLQLVATDLDKTNHHAESVLSFEIWDPIDLDITFIWDRVEKPVSDDNGDTPKSNDYRLLVGLSIEF
jgi:YD repeat-containing protein